jgi:prepilin-type N-terminal cleavage/methylation domain-containing protein
MHQSVRRHNSGFTLIEVLVAVAILVIVMGAIYGAFRAGNQSSVFLEENSDLHQTARVILAQISSELSSLHPIPGEQTSDLVGEHTDVAGGSLYFDKLRFTTVSHKPSSKNVIQGDACMVTYSAECTADGEPLGLYIIEDFTPGLHNSQDEIDALPATRVSDLVVGMDCSYLDPDTSEWVDEWVDKSSINN